jgi:hypothetical protein
MLAVNDVALKEWAVICRKLADGHHILLVRKGGIREPRTGFSVEHNEFFLFPTYFHQTEDELIQAARAALPDVTRAVPPAGLVHLDLYAQVTEVIDVTDLDALRRLDGQHALAWDAVARRFNYRRPGLHVMALRIFRLSAPLRIENLARYDGCRSWVSLESAYPTAGCRPVLPETEFQRRVLAFRASLGC